MPVNAVENRLLLYAVDGENYSPIALSLYDISIDDVVETDDSRSIKYLKYLKYLQNPVSMTITLPHKKMSRKKFKKWLMSKGFHRDIAEWFCKVVKSFKGTRSYRLLYFNGLFSSTSQDLFNVLFDTLFPINKYRNMTVPDRMEVTEVTPAETGYFIKCKYMYHGIGQQERTFSDVIFRDENWVVEKKGVDF